MHGGTAPQVRAAARRRLADAEAAATVAALVPDEPPPVRDPMGALARLAGELVAAREAAGGLVAGLDAIADPSGNLAAEIRLWLALVDRSTRALIDLAKLSTSTEIAPVQVPSDRDRALFAVISDALDAVDADGRDRIMEALRGDDPPGTI